MEKRLTLGSLFDGSGCFPLAGMLSGIEPVWASEIEPFPIRVTTRRMPNVKHLGDIKGLDGSKIQPVDIITFGSPCQDMSIAGRRDGLEGSRSSLFFEAIRIAREMRTATQGRYPGYLVWENVQGAFSSNGGRDFRAVIEEIISLRFDGVSIPVPQKWRNSGLVMAEGFSLAWRVLDAQYWGVPQRRKRIWLVADLDGERAGDILFDSEGLSWDSETCLNEGEGAAGGAEKGAGETVGNILRLFSSHPSDARVKGPVDKADTITGVYGTGGGNTPLVTEEAPATEKDNHKQADSPDGKCTSVVFGISAKESNAMNSPNPRAGVYVADTSRTLDANGGNPSCNQGGMAVVYGIGRTAVNSGYDSGMSFPIEKDLEPTLTASGPNSVMHSEEKSIAVLEGNGSRPSHRGDGFSEGDVSYTLNTVDRHCVAYGDVWATSKASYHTTAVEGLSPTLVASDYKDPPSVSVDGECRVRRLTPGECARLQGFPDWWCSDLGEDEPSEEEIKRWRGIFLTAAKAYGRSARPKSDSEIRRWLKNPHSDSAEYRMWGNGMALPCARYVLTGIANHDEKEKRQ